MSVWPPVEGTPPREPANESPAEFLPVSTHRRNPEKRGLICSTTSPLFVFSGEQLSLGPCVSSGDLPLRVLAAMPHQHYLWKTYDLRARDGRN